MLLIDTLDNSFSVTRQEALKLELSLNLSKYGKEWKHIGDKLYCFYTGDTNENKILLTPYQFNYLINLLNPSEFPE